MHYRNIRASVWFALFVATFVRILQFFSCLDPVTGFIKQDYKLLGFGLLAVVFVVAFVVMGLSFTVRRCPVRVPRLSRISGALSLLLALCILYSLTTIGNSASIPHWQSLLLKITGALAAVFFGALFVKSLKNFSIPQVCFVTPVLYFLVKLIYVFTASSVIALISDNILYLATCIFTLLFMFLFCVAKMQDGENTVYKKIAATGFTAVVFSVATAAPQILAAVFERPSGERVNLFDAVTILFTALFIFSFLRDYFSDRNLKRRRINPKSPDADVLSANDFYTG